MTRESFEPRRQGEAFEFTHGNVPYHVVANRLPDGKLGEVFIDAGKTGSDADIVADEAAVLVSLALQYGTPLSTIRAALPKLADGKPAGPMGQALKMAEQGR